MTATHSTFAGARLLESIDRRSADGMTSLNPFQKYMLRVLLFHAGKTILHRKQICEVMEKHTQLRQLMPLVDKDLNDAKPQLFWLSLRPASRKQMRQERIRR